MTSPAAKTFFVPTYGDLLDALRLGANIDKPEAALHSLINQAILKARTYLLSKLTPTVANTIAALAYDPNDTSTDGIRRTTAVLAETELVRYYLRPEMRVFIGQGASSVHESWKNDFLLSLDEKAFQKRQQQLRQEIDQMVDFLIGAGGVETFDDNEINVSTLNRPAGCPAPRPGATVYGTPLHLGTFLAEFNKNQ